MSAFCSNCHDSFECKPEDIGNCGCQKISLSPEEIAYISTLFEGCLCNKCLSDIKKQLTQKMTGEK